MTLMLDFLKVEPFNTYAEVSDEFGLFDRISSTVQRGVKWILNSPWKEQPMSTNRPFNFETEPFEFYSESDEFENEFDTGLVQQWGEDEEAPVPKSLAMRKPTPVKARILWPALGFPAVIAPRDKPGISPFQDGDATRCICVLILSDQKYLSKEAVARYLRLVPWAARGRRNIPVNQPAGTFREEELAVRHHDQQPSPLWKNSNDLHGEILTFGGNGDGINSICAKLSSRVRKIYADKELKFLHEIRVYEGATARFKDGLYHLFWNNETANEQVTSDEMAFLLRTVAVPRRAKLGKLWQEHSKYLIDEYEYEYGACHGPYNESARSKGPRAEVLHPLFVQRDRSPILKIGHITDTHVDTRMNVYAENLKRAEAELSRMKIPLPVQFNNSNTSFVQTYNSAKKDSDILLLTGDLIDYGRGYCNLDRQSGLDRDDFYHEDRNWFLFYSLLASGKSYTCPTYTILGNHDWRINPYTPFAIAGAPNPETLIHNSDRYTPDQRKIILQKAHGPGYKRLISYIHEIESKWELFRARYIKSSLSQLVGIVLGGNQTADLPKYPTETKVESVEWYLLTINPFLDYWFTHPRGPKILMLDWAEDENVFFPEITHGRKHGINFLWFFGGDPGGEGPKARNCLTNLQAEMVAKFTEDPGSAKVIGIHAPPIGPWTDWYDDELRSAWKTYGPDETPRGSLGFAMKTSGFPRPLQGHPFFALRPPLQVSSDPVWGMDAVYNSFEKNRDWFIKRVSDQRFGVRLVLSGHIHRNGLFAAYIAGKQRGPALAGQMLIQSLPAEVASGARPPAVFRIPVERTSAGFRLAPGPLYVNTTSAGPRGHLFASKKMQKYVIPGFAYIELTNDGTIQKVKFREMGDTEPLKPVTPQPELGVLLR